jgi:molecular chaperone GrpE (heat shock protein)
MLDANDLNRIETKISDIEQELNTTTKKTHDNAKDIEFLKKTIEKDGDNMKEQIEKQAEDFKEHRKEEEKEHEKIKTDAVKDIKIWLYGVVLVVVGNFLFNVLKDALK